MSELKPKVKALYEAVFQLLSEGEDLRNLTVSQIAAAAGIGKGTTYEYFQTKEQLIVSAMYYYVQKKLRGAVEGLSAFNATAQKIDYMFDWVEDNFKGGNTSGSFLGFIFSPDQLDNSFAEAIKEFHKEKHEECCEIPEIIAGLVEDGRNAGEIREDVPLQGAILLIFSTLGGMATYLKNKPSLEEKNADEMKTFLCASLKKSLLK